VKIQKAMKIKEIRRQKKKNVIYGFSILFYKRDYVKASS